MQKLSSVLLVDDDSTNNFLNELLLKRLEVTDHLLVAENGSEALALLAERAAASEANIPALIFLDVNMPVMNGIEFLEAYQQLPTERQRASIIVMLTTTMDGRDLARIQELPIAGLVSKPLTEEKVNTILQLHFQRQLSGH
jgi:CheY-like chemotaxis protein